MTDLPLILNGRQARAYLGLGKTTFTRLVRTGVIPCWRDPDTNTRHYSRLVLDEWAANLVTPKAAS